MAVDLGDAADHQSSHTDHDDSGAPSCWYNSITTRPSRSATASTDDAEQCGRIFYAAFEAIAERHSFPVEPGSPEFANYKIGELLETEGIFGIVAERAGDHRRQCVRRRTFARSPESVRSPLTLPSQNAGVGRPDASTAATSSEPGCGR